MAATFPVPNFDQVRSLAQHAGFELAGVVSAGAISDFPRYEAWTAQGFAGAMGYLTDHRGALRSDVRSLLPSARSVIAVGKLYNGPQAYSTAFDELGRGWISRYAWGDDYHPVLRAGLERLAHRLQALAGTFEWKACVDTAPVLERSIARDAGLGWIGKNTCLINQQHGSWFFLGELLTSLPLSPTQGLQPDRCGTCTRCIDACPTQAIVPASNGRYEIDARSCIAYLTIELRGSIEEQYRPNMGAQVFGCDICQDVCPWNRTASVTRDASFEPRRFAPPLKEMAQLSESEFREMFRDTPVERARYRGFLRNVAVAMGNSGSPELIGPLERLARSTDPMIAEHAAGALLRLRPGCAFEQESQLTT